MSLLCRLKNLVHKGVLKEKDLERIVIVPKGQEPCDCISRQAVLDMVEDMTDQFGNKHRVVTEGMINLLPPVTPKPKTDVLDKIKAEIEEQVLESLSDGGDDWFVAEKVNECLEIIDRYKAESEDKDER